MQKSSLNHEATVEMQPPLQCPCRPNPPQLRLWVPAAFHDGNRGSDGVRVLSQDDMSNVCKLWRLWSIGVGWVLQFYFRASSKDLVLIFHSTIQESLTWSKLVQTLNRQNIKLTRKITAGSKSHHLAMMMTMIMMLMDDEWSMINDKWWIIMNVYERLWIIIMMMNDEWWMMDYGWWMMDDTWWWWWRRRRRWCPWLWLPGSFLPKSIAIDSTFS